MEEKITQISSNGQIDKPVVINTYNGILFSLKKEGDFAICYDIFYAMDTMLSGNKV